jgi:hypothetical protein
MVNQSELFLNPLVSASDWKESELSGAEWADLIQSAQGISPLIVEAESYRSVKASSHSSPVLLACEDGREYFVKGRQNPRAISNDCIVGRLANAMGAPVPLIQLVQVSAALIAANPDMQHLLPGISLGSLSLYPNIGDKDGTIKHHNFLENRGRFASLAFLYGIVEPNDVQFFYEKHPPHLVHSVDHGHFFPGGPVWHVDRLQSSAPARPYDAIMRACNFTEAEVLMAMRAVALIKNETIAHAVAAPPPQWGLLLDHRVAVARYLHEQVKELLKYRHANA